MGMTNLKYMPAFSTPNYKINCEEKEKKSFTSLYLLILSFSIFALIISWLLFQIYFSWILKSVILANLLTSISWELTYFDSLKPPVQFSSLPSPPQIRLKSGYTFHLNYALATLLGVLCSLFISNFI